VIEQYKQANDVSAVNRAVVIELRAPGDRSYVSEQSVRHESLSLAIHKYSWMRSMLIEIVSVK